MVSFNNNATQLLFPYYGDEFLIPWFTDPPTLVLPFPTKKIKLHILSDPKNKIGISEYFIPADRANNYVK